MASVRKRETGVGIRWDVRYRDPDGRQRRQTFTKKGAADRFSALIEADKLRGTYLDPDAGRVTFKTFATQWLAAQTFDASTREMVELRLRVHAFPALGDRQLRQVKPSTIQGWLRSLHELAPSYRRVIFANVSAVFGAAVDDEALLKNPCRAPSVSAPKVEQHKVVPWTAARMHAVRAAMPERYRIFVTLAAGLGLRQGEVFGLAPDDIDFLRGRIEIRRQVKLFANGGQAFALPKGGKTRSIPLPASVRDNLAAHLALQPARPVTLPWGHPEGAPTTAALVTSTREGTALNRNYLNTHVWKRALTAAQVETSRQNGCHALRHFYASTLLDAGESIKALSEYLGHADAGFTLRTYTHLMPASDERTRRAIDAVLTDADGTEMAQDDDRHREKLMEAGSG